MTANSYRARVGLAVTAIAVTVIALILTAGCTSKSSDAGNRGLGSQGSGNQGAGGSQLQKGTATGELRLSGDLTGVWRWQAPLDVCNSANSVTLAKEGDASAVISLTLGPDDLVGIAGTVVPGGGVSGHGGVFVFGDEGVTTMKVPSLDLTYENTTIHADGEIVKKC